MSRRPPGCLLSQRLRHAEAVARLLQLVLITHLRRPHLDEAEPRVERRQFRAQVDDVEVEACAAGPATVVFDDPNQERARPVPWCGGSTASIAKYPVRPSIST